jgi:hypothetical protein
VIDKGVVQVQDPAGITTVVPLAAELTAVCTSLTLHEAALIEVWASTPATDDALKINENNSPFMIRINAVPPK